MNFEDLFYFPNAVFDHDHPLKITYTTVVPMTPEDRARLKRNLSRHIEICPPECISIIEEIWKGDAHEQERT